MELHKKEKAFVFSRQYTAKLIKKTWKMKDARYFYTWDHFDQGSKENILQTKNSNTPAILL